MFKILKSYIILIAIILNSSIFAINVNFSDPTTTPSDLGTPNLSDSGENAGKAQIATDSTGNYVYAVWERSDGTNTIIQAARSVDFGETWTDPTTTPSDLGTPNLSDSGEAARRAQIATDSSGRYVYAVWERSDGINFIIQTAISSDFGVTWVNPTLTPPGTAPPNLSDPGPTGMSSNRAQIATDSSGTYVYAIWQRFDGRNSAIQIAISSDFGVTWVNPTLTPPGTAPPNLSNSTPPAGDAKSPQIATDSSGRFVYAIWERDNGIGPNIIIQTAISSDFGVTWGDPTSTPPGTSPNLSVSNQDAFNAQIATDSSGRYVYAVWERSDGRNNIIQTAISSDFGVTWVNPITTPSDLGSPNLSFSGQNAQSAQIATDSGSVYAIWQRFDGRYNIIQIAISSDFGETWVNPTTTPSDLGSPNLSDSGQSAQSAQVATDSSGNYIYAIWQRFDGRYNIIQTATGFKTFSYKKLND